MSNKRLLTILRVEKFQSVQPEWCMERIMDEIALEDVCELIETIGLIEAQWRCLRGVEVGEMMRMSAVVRRGSELMPEGGDDVQEVLRRIGVKGEDFHKTVEEFLCDYFRVGLERDFIGVESGLNSIKVDEVGVGANECGRVACGGGVAKRRSNLEQAMDRMFLDVG